MSKITVADVTKQYGSKLAVAGVSFEVPPGKIFGLLGPNGAGKTTLIRMLMDIIRPDTGTILYDGHALTDEVKDRITYLPEERGLYRKEKVRDVLEYFARLKGLSRAEARQRTLFYLEKLEMTDVARKKVEELSKGNQQKVQIAATLVSNPDIIILDEPFSGLDPLNVRVTKSLLAEATMNGKTILLSTHQMNQVEELCDNVMMIHDGKQVLYGSVEQILQQYSEQALLLECTPIDDTIPEIESVVQAGKFQKVYPRPGVSPATILRALIDRGAQIERFQKATTPFEEIFVRVARENRPGGRP